jgi:hypothetical protein
MTIAEGFANLNAAASARRLAIACRRDAEEYRELAPQSLAEKWASESLAEAERHKKRAFDRVDDARMNLAPPLPDRRRA